MTKKKPVEDLARAAYEASNKSGGLQMPWTAQSEVVREKWRQAVAEPRSAKGADKA